MPSATAPPPPLPSSIPDLSQKLPPLKLTGNGPRRRTPQKQAQSSTPAPKTPPLPSPPSLKDIKFTHPTRRILSPHDHELFLASPTYTLIVSFIFTLSDSVRGLSISSVASSKEASDPTIQSILRILDTLEQTIQECPPDDNGGSRFGNPAFKTYINAVTSKLPDLHTTHFTLPPPPTASSTSTANDELTTYLLSSLGSPTRIDYGSGHELHFLIYLLTLYSLSLLPPTTFPALVLLIFPRYLALMRTLQATYYLEPAGSHGVWGLDDYHFLPFLFGASQLRHHGFIRPLGIHSEATLHDYASDYLYLDMVRYVNATKTVQGLRWHSPMLDDISGVKGGWEKVESGLKKMFVKEVVGKLVVMQHFLFGGVVPAVEGMSVEDAHVEEEGDYLGHDGHEHGEEEGEEGKGWGDCCGIKVPSNAGAVGEMRKRMGTEGLRRLPFD